MTTLASERADRKRSSFKPSRGTPRAWLFTIARNAALDELRAMAPRPSAEFAARATRPSA